MQKQKIKSTIQKTLAYTAITTLSLAGLVQAWKMAELRMEKWHTDFFVMKTDDFIIKAPKAKEKENFNDWSVQEKIVYYADIFGVEKETALRIAECESQFDPNAENVNGSATGVYQFIRKTWKNNCKGDVKNPDANIICFMENYEAHKDWWECR